MKLTKLLLVCGLLIFAACKKDNCKDTNCLNDGICNDGKCDCPEGFSGERCELRDSCYGLKCENGSTCKGDSCACLTTFYGKNCENSLVHNKRYVVKNINLIHDINNVPCNMDYSTYVKLNDTLSASVIIDKSKVVELIFSNANFRYQYQYVYNSYFQETYSRLVGCDYIETYRGTYYDKGDSIHVKIFREYKSRYVYEDLASYDLIKIQ